MDSYTVSMVSSILAFAGFRDLPWRLGAREEPREPPSLSALPGGRVWSVDKRREMLVSKSHNASQVFVVYSDNALYIAEL